MSIVGERYAVEVGAVAHGGHCVARHEGRVIFVRHALPGERVVVEITEGDDTSRFLRGDAIEVTEASADRVDPPCPHAGPGACGGCDWQHVSLPAQRAMKAAVVAEQLQRIAGLERDVVVEELPGAPQGLGWRTRLRFAVDDQARAGLRRHRSHDLEPLSTCAIAHPEVLASDVLEQRWPDTTDVLVAVAGTPPQEEGAPAVVGGATVLRIAADGSRTKMQGPAAIVNEAAGRRWRSRPDGFWQVHPAAADTLAAAVREGARVGAGETVVDLYAGVGLFAGVLAQDAGEQGAVLAVESSAAACRDARTNLRDLAQVEVVHERVDTWLRRRVRDGGRADVIVLDPPRKGATKVVIAPVVALAPRAIVLVACDPAALARDVGLLAEAGYTLEGLRAFDLFPMTHHVECVATFLGP